MMDHTGRTLKGPVGMVRMCGPHGNITFLPDYHGTSKSFHTPDSIKVSLSPAVIFRFFCFFLLNFPSPTLRSVICRRLRACRVHREEDRVVVLACQ